MGLPFILFIPGYVLVFTLFPGKGISIAERIALSFGLSIAVVPLIGLGLNYTPWGINMEPIVACLISFVMAMAVIGWYRWRQLPTAKRYSFSIGIRWPQSTNNLDRALNVVIVATLAITFILLAYVLVTPSIGESFTEFYLLGPTGKAAEYPTTVAVGERGTVIAGIANHEHEQIEYTLESWLINYSFYLQLDGKDGYVEVPSSPSLHITDGITIEAWVKLTAYPDYDDGTNWRWVMRKTGSWDMVLEQDRRPTWSVNVNNTRYRWSVPQPPWPIGVWIHVGWMYDSVSGEMTAFLNESMYTLNQTGIVGDLDTNNNPLLINWAGDTVSPIGNGDVSMAIQDLRIYDRVLSQTEIQQNYHAADEEDMIMTGLISWWKMNEGRGDIAEDHIGLNDGTIHGALWLNSGTVINMWFIDSARVTLNHTEVDVEKNWTGQWEHPYSFNKSNSGVFKVVFLLFKNRVDDFVKGNDYAEEAERLLQAYREVHIWTTVLHLPVANFSYDPVRPSASDIITFVDTSSIIRGSIVNWAWDFGDGNGSFGDTALVFDGIDDYVDCGSRTSFDITTNCTIDFWFRPHDLTKSFSRIIRKNGAYSIHLSPTTGALRIQEYSEGSYVDSDAVFSENVWQHVTLVKNGPQVRWYRNGVNAGAGALADRDFPSSKAALYFGLDEDLSSKAFNGSIKEVRMYNRMLTATEVKNSYYGNVTTDGLLHWWKVTGNRIRDIVMGSMATIHGTSSINVASHYYSESGKYQVVLTVVNDGGLSSSIGRELVID